MPARADGPASRSGSGPSCSADRSLVFSIWALATNERLFLVTVLNGLTLGSLYFIVAAGLHAGVRADAQRQPRARLALSARRLRRLRRRRADRLVAAGGGRRLCRCRGGRARDAARHLPSHAGRGPAPDDGDDRPVDRHRGPPALGASRARCTRWSRRRGWARHCAAFPMLNAYSSYRLSLLPIGIAIGVVLWLFLNRTRVGMMIRAGVDDRGMLAASGVNVNRIFADHVRDRRRPRGPRRRHRRGRAVDGAGRGHAAAACVAGGGDRRRHGQRRRCGDRRGDPRPRRNVRPRLCARRTAWCLRS